jgi:hypothetical protein
VLLDGPALPPVARMCLLQALPAILLAEAHGATHLILNSRQDSDLVAVSVILLE